MIDYDNPVIREGLNVLDNFLGLFGVKITKAMKGKKWDWANVQNAINQVYSRLESANEALLSRAQQKLDMLIGLPGSSLIRNIANKARAAINNRMREINASGAKIAIKKANAQNLANELDSLSAGDWNSSQGKRIRESIKSNLNEAKQAGDQQRLDNTNLSAVETII